jgi:hypothetical protein
VSKGAAGAQMPKAPHSGCRQRSAEPAEPVGTPGGVVPRGVVLPIEVPVAIEVVPQALPLCRAGSRLRRCALVLY